MKKLFLLQCFLWASVAAFAQTLKPYAPIYQETVKGDMLVIGNSIINKGKYPANTPTKVVFPLKNEDSNNSVELNFTDVDNDPSTFNSSSADLLNPVKGVNARCSKIKKAYLYWAAHFTRDKLNKGRLMQANFNKVKFKTPNGGYQQLTADELIFDGLTGGVPEVGKENRAYIARKDVTNLVAAGGFGTYFVADMQAPQQTASEVNSSAGWVLYVVYENPDVRSHYITLFNGFATVINKPNGAVTFPISGFKTTPVGTVNAKIGFAALEGELPWIDDAVQIKGKNPNFEYIQAPGRQDLLDNLWCHRKGPNFFNSTVTDENGINTHRNPASENLFGFDAGIADVPNSGNHILDNTTTSVQIKLTAEGGCSDAYNPFMFAFSIEVMRPEVELVKTVWNTSNQNITGQQIQKGTPLVYQLQFRNTGADDVEGMVITDKLPSTIDFDPATANYQFPNSPGMTAADVSYNVANHELTFRIPNSLVNREDHAWHQIRFSVKAASDCSRYIDACSNVIKNQAVATGKGKEDKKQFTAQSYNGVDCSTREEGPSNVVVDLSNCVAERTEVLCKGKVTITAGNGFDTYRWTKKGSTQVLGTKQTLEVSEPGVYRVDKTKPGCVNAPEEITVKYYEEVLNNPISKYINDKRINGEVFKCANDGLDYPQIYLCGANARAEISLSGRVNNAVSYKWQKRVNCTVPSSHPKDCPVRNEYGCTWQDVATGPNVSLRDRGDYRVEITYNPGQCVATHYFTITKNDIRPQVDKRDIICTKKGTIKINNVPTNYKFALYQGTSMLKNYQDSSEFTIDNPGTYTVKIKQELTTTATYSPCIFEETVQIDKRTPNLVVTTKPMNCSTSQGSIRIQLEGNPYPPITYTIRRDNATKDIVDGPTKTNSVDYTKTGLNNGAYIVEAKTDDGCSLTQRVTVAKTTDIQATASVLQDIMCGGQGSVRVTVTGGTPHATTGYNVVMRPGGTSRQTYKNGYTDFTITTAGTYSFEVVDQNGCKVTTAAVTIKKIAEPSFTANYVPTQCGATAKIVVTTTNPTGYNFTFEYSLDNGTYQSGNEFPGVASGRSHTVKVRYKYGSNTCELSPKTVTVPAQTDTHLLASAGVESLIGCGTGANADKAKVRFTNVEGGDGNYQFSFDGGNSWTTNRSAYLPAGTHNLYVKDGAGCQVGPIKVEVKKKPDQPNLQQPTVTYSCEGKGSFTINKPAGYNYEYSIDGGATWRTDNNFKNLAPGTYNVLVRYSDATIPTPNVLFNETFGQGKNTSTPYINKKYHLQLQTGETPKNALGGLSSYGPHKTLADGEYVVTHSLGADNNGAWVIPNDHTGLPDGRYLMVNIGDIIGRDGAILYQRKITDILPNKKIKFSIALMNLLAYTDGRYPGGAPDIALELYYNETGILDGSSRVASERINPRIRGWRNANDWTVKTFELDPGTHGTLYAVVRSYSDVTDGNDLAIDDIYLWQQPEICPFTQTITVKVDNGRAFKIDDSSERTTQPTCNTGTGSYQIGVLNPPAAGYYVSKDGGAFVRETANPFVWNNIAPGNHRVVISYEANNTTPCKFTKNVNISAPTAITAPTVQGGDLGCSPATFELIATGVTGGKAPYKYNFYRGTTRLAGPQASNKYTVNAAGTYTVWAVDDNGCEGAKTTVVVNPAKTLTLQENATGSDYCAAPTAKVAVKVTVTGGGSEAPYTYKLNGIVKSPNNPSDTYVFTGLSAGNYTAEVIGKNGCSATYNFEIKNKIQTVGGAVVIKDIFCTAANKNGKITLTVKDGYPPYTYIIRRGTTQVQGATPVPPTGVISYETATAGTYTFEVTDSKGCKTSSNATLTNPTAPSVTVTTTDIKCNGAGNGEAKVTITGGTAPYNLFIGTTPKGMSNGQITLTGIAVGTHTLKIVDAKGCETTTTIVIREPEPLVGFAAVAGLIGCGTGANADKAKVRISNVKGGTRPYQYSFGGNFSSNKEVWVPAGTHTVTIRDAKGCEKQLTVTVPPKIADPVVTQTIVDYDCEGKATVRFTGTPGTYNFEYHINGKVVSGTTGTISGLTPGTYTATIKYRNTVLPANSMLIDEDFGFGAEACLGEIDPLATIELQCFQNCPTTRDCLVNHNGYGIVNRKSQALMINVFPGGWTQPNSRHYAAGTTLGDTDRFMNMDMADGQPGTNDILYEKLVNDVDPTRKIKFELWIYNLFQDNSIPSPQGKLPEDPELTFEIVDASNNVLFRKDSGKIPKNGGNPDAWIKFDGESTNVAGTNSVKIRIRNKNFTGYGCDFLVDDIKAFQEPETCWLEKEITVNVPTGHEFKVTQESQTNAACNGTNTGKVKFNVENIGSSGSTYNIKVNNVARPALQNLTAATIEIDNLQPGSNTVVFENRGCVVTKTVNITQPNPLSLTATITTPAMCSNNKVARVTLTTVGGTPAYTYTWHPAGGGAPMTQSSPMFDITAPASGSFVVKDANGCVATTTGSFTVREPKLVTFNTEKVGCYSGNNDGWIEVKNIDGNDGYKLQIDGGTSITLTAGATNYRFNGLSQGTHTIRVIDQYGCESSTTVTIDGKLDVNTSVVPVSCVAGKITVTATGGNGTYQYAFKEAGTAGAPVYGAANSITVPVFAGTSKNYEIYVKSGDCTKTSTVTVNKADDVDFTLTKVEPSCNGSADGKITLNNIKGDTTFTVTVTGGATPQTFGGINTRTYTINNLAAGSYSIGVTDKYGCVVNKTITLADFPVLEGTLSVTAGTGQCTTTGTTAIGLTVHIKPADYTNYTARYDLCYSVDNGTSWHAVTGANTNIPVGSGYTPGTSVILQLKTITKGGNCATDPAICTAQMAAYVVPGPIKGVTVSTTVPTFTDGCVHAPAGFNATVTVPAGEGNPPFQYRVNGGAWEPTTPTPNRTYTFNNLIVGRTYLFEVKDSYGCIAVSEKDIYEGVATPAVTVTTEPKHLCAGTTTGGQLTITVTRSASYTSLPAGATYNWTVHRKGLGTTPGPIVASGGPRPFLAAGVPDTFVAPVPANLTAGTYYVVIKENTPNQCEWGSRDVEIKVLSPLTLTFTATTNITCATDGTIDIKANGGGGKYTYKVEPANPADFVNPIAASTAPTLTVPRSNIANAPVHPDPAKNVTVNITVTDQYGCTEMKTHTFVVAPSPKINRIEGETCSTTLGLTVWPQAKAPAAANTNAPATELGDYEYTIDGGVSWQASNVFTGLVPTTYDVRIREKATGCEYTYPGGYVLSPTLEVELSVTPITCNTPPDGKIHIDVKKGSGKYHFTVTSPVGVTPATPPSGVIVAAPATKDITVTQPGVYTITVHDDATPASCVGFTKTITVNAGEVPNFDVNTQSVTCHGGTDGAIYIIETNAAIGAYTYAIQGSAGVVPAPGADKKIPNLKAGVYTITATAPNNCKFTRTVTITEPTAITVSATQIQVQQFGCDPSGNAQSAQITVPNSAISGGTPPYVISYQFKAITGTGNTFIIGDATGGIATITITDSSGCSTVTTRQILPYEGFDENTATVTVTGGTCATGDTAQVKVQRLGGGSFTTGQVFYAHSATKPTSPIGTAPEWQASDTFTNLAVNTLHTFWIGHKTTGCIIQVSYRSVDPNNFRITDPRIKNVTCKGDNDGTASFTLSNTVAGHNYQATFQTSAGGTAVAPITVPASNIITVPNLKPATYTMTVTDLTSQCVQSTTFTIEEPDAALTATTSVQSITCQGNDGKISVVSPTGGWGGYEYYVGTTTPGAGAIWTTTNEFSNLTPGTYHVWIRDRGGCAKPVGSTINLVNPNPITGTVTITAQNCGVNVGQITVQNVQGGAGKDYIYQLIKDGAPLGSPQTSNVFSGLGAGHYQVVVSDAWGCTATLTSSATLYDPVTDVDAKITKQVTCTPATGATLSVTYQGGSTNLWFTLKTSPAGTVVQQNAIGVFTNVPAGKYKVDVFDRTTGCATATTAAEIDVTDAATVTFTTTQTNVSCHGDNNGSFVVTLPASQTQTDYQVRVVGAAPFTPRVETVNTTPKDISFEGLTAGVYTITVTSSRNCTTTSTVTITEPNKLIVSNTTTVTTHFKCDADNNAMQAVIKAVADGGTAPYQYAFQVYDGTSTNTSAFTNSDVYSVTSAGSATQTIVVYIRDANGCTASNSTTPIVLPPLKRITDIGIVKTQPINCNQPEKIDITIVGGSNKGYRIDITTTGAGTPVPATQTLTAGVNTLNGVQFDKPGNYTIQVTDLATDCYTSTNYFIDKFDTIEAKATVSSSVTCYGANDGSIELTITGYRGSYRYTVYDANTLTSITPPKTAVIPGSGSATRTDLITGLPQGSYVVRIEEQQSPFCTVTTTTAIIGQPSAPITLSPTITNRLTCNGGGNDGAFSIDAKGGWGTYEYRLLVGGTPHAVYGTYSDTSVFRGLSAATYTVQVRDKGGCETSTNVVIAPPTPITATYTSTVRVNCYGDKTAVIQVTSTTGGSGNYTYELWNVGGAQVYGTQTDTTFSGLYAGVYKVKIIDGWGCDTELGPITILEPDEIRVTAAIVDPQTCLHQATISVTATGGTGAYAYGESATGPWSSVNTFVKGTGTYTFYVRDANGCVSKASNSIDIKDVPQLTIGVRTDTAYVKCNGDASAQITFSATGGLGNYQYKLYKGGVAQTATATQISATDWAFGGLTSGTYQVVVTSVDCVATETIQINEAPALQVGVATHTDISCFGEKDGTISVTVTGGTGKILYAITPRLDRFEEKNFFDKLAKGKYTVLAQDENGCFREFHFEIKEPTLLRAAIDKKTDEVCIGSADGTVSITITGGTPTYTTSIDKVTWTPNKTLYTGLASGTHFIYVKDARGCETTVPVNIGEGVDLQATATVEYSCPNNGVKNTIKASVNPQHSVLTSFRLDGGAKQASGTFNNVAAGVHTITFEHANGCTRTLTVTVEAYTSLTATTATKTDITCYGLKNGTITYEVTGGTGSYTYEITPNTSTFSGTGYTGLSQGYYTVKVRDNVLGCEISQVFNIIEPDQLIATAKTVTETCFGQNDGALSFTIKGGRPAYNYTLKDPSGSVIGSGNLAVGAVVTKTSMTPGRYMLEYGDSGSCTQTLEISIAAAPDLRPSQDIEVKVRCATSSTTYTTGYVVVTFNNANGTLTRSNTSYAINSTDPADARPFAEFNGNQAITHDIDAGDNQEITIFYKGAGVATVCHHTVTKHFDIKRYPGLEVKDKSDVRRPNHVIVEARGGQPPYTYYFNGLYNGTNEYTVRGSDPGRTANGRIYKTVVVRAVDEAGCETFLTLEKEYIKSVPPTHFTPNDDGQNDGWDPDPDRSYPNAVTRIYDRYGRLIKELRAGEKWDGRYDGKEMPSGDYWYIMRLNDEADDREFMGHFTLYR